MLPAPNKREREREGKRIACLRRLLRRRTRWSISVLSRRLLLLLLLLPLRLRLIARVLLNSTHLPLLLHVRLSRALWSHLGGLHVGWRRELVYIFLHSLLHFQLSCLLVQHLHLRLQRARSHLGLALGGRLPEREQARRPGLHAGNRRQGRRGRDTHIHLQLRTGSCRP